MIISYFPQYCNNTLWPLYYLLQTNSTTKFICTRGQPTRWTLAQFTLHCPSSHPLLNTMEPARQSCWHRCRISLRQTPRVVVLVGVFFISLRQHKTKVEIVERRYIWNLLLAVNIITVYMGNYQCVHKFWKYDVFHFNVNVCLGCLDVCITFVVYIWVMLCWWMLLVLFVCSDNKSKLLVLHLASIL